MKIHGHFFFFNYNKTKRSEKEVQTKKITRELFKF